MQFRREGKSSLYRSAGQWSTAVRAESDPVSDSKLIRLLVLDDDSGTPEQIENALWIWPHRISVASSLEHVVRMCRHLKPAAVIASLNNFCQHDQNIIGCLRDEFPDVAIIALFSAADVSSPGAILDLGADAVIRRDDLRRPTLHDLLMRLRSVSERKSTEEVPSPVDSMPLPWRDSRIAGSIVCDIKGTIAIANECLAKWLGYAEPSAISGKCVWRDILQSKTDWTPWKTIAGDTTALFYQSVTVKTRDEQLLWMDVEVFAAPHSPSHLQAVFIGQSELAHHSGRTVSAG